MLADEESVFLACCGIAKDVNAQCEYISDATSECESTFEMAPTGPSLKIAVEFGKIDIAEISSRTLGTQRLFIGEAINYASRISAAGEGNRCLIGPVAAARMTGYGLEGPHKFEGKKSGGPFTYFELDLGDIWRAGPLADGEESFWP